MNTIPYYINTPLYSDAVYDSIYWNNMYDGMSIHNSSRDILSHMCHNTHHIISSNWRNGDRTRRNNDYNSNAIYNSVNRYGVMGINATNNMGRLNLNATNDASWRLNESIYRNGNDTRRSIYHNAHHTNDLLYHHNTASMYNHKTTQLEIQKLKNDLEKQNIETRGVLGLQISRSESDIMLQNFNNFTELQKQADYNTAAIQLDAYKNKQQLSMEIKHCKCDMESLIKQQTNNTNVLINNNQTQNLKDQLNSINTENLILKNA